MENIQNIFSQALICLFESKKYKKKDVAALLGVTPAAVTQWTKGKTVPEPDKIRTILRLFRDESDKENIAYKNFLSILELSVKKSLDDSSTKILDDKLSDYILKSVVSSTLNSYHYLFYDIKLELINHFARQINLVVNNLIDSFFPNDQEEDNSFKRSKKLNWLSKEFGDPKNFDKLQFFTSCVKNYNADSEQKFAAFLSNIDLESKNFQENVLTPKTDAASSNLLEVQFGDKTHEYPHLVKSRITNSATINDRDYYIVTNINSQENIKRSLDKIVMVSSGHLHALSIESITYGIIKLLYENHFNINLNDVKDFSELQSKIRQYLHIEEAPLISNMHP